MSKPRSASLVIGESFQQLSAAASAGETFVEPATASTASEAASASINAQEQMPLRVDDLVWLGDLTPDQFNGVLRRLEQTCAERAALWDEPFWVDMEKVEGGEGAYAFRATLGHHTVRGMVRAPLAPPTTLPSAPPTTLPAARRARPLTLPRVNARWQEAREASLALVCALAALAEVSGAARLDDILYAEPSNPNASWLTAEPLLGHTAPQTLPPSPPSPPRSSRWAAASR